MRIVGTGFHFSLFNVRSLAYLLGILILLYPLDCDRRKTYARFTSASLILHMSVKWIPVSNDWNPIGKRGIPLSPKDAPTT